MTDREKLNHDKTLSRRTLVQALAAGAGAMVAGAGTAAAQQAHPRRRRAPSPIRRATSARGAHRPPISGTPTSSRSTRASTVSRSRMRAIQRLYTGVLWAEGPAWSAQGRYLVWSDIPNNRQMRWSEDDGRVSVFRTPSNNSNGNTFDFQGRQLSCEHLTRRVVRYEHDGTSTVIADAYQRQEAQLAERRRAASRWQLLVHRSALWRPALRRRAGCRGRPEQCRRPAQSAHRPACRLRARPPRAADQLLSRRPERARRSRRQRGPGARSQRALLLARLQEALRRVDRQGSGRHRPGRQGRHPRVRRRLRQQAVEPEAVHRLHGRRREVRAGRRALRRQRQSLGSRAMPAAPSATAA